MDRLINIIKDNKQSLVYRGALVDVIKGIFWKRLSVVQKEKCNNSFFQIMIDKNESQYIREKCVRILDILIWGKVLRVLNKDKNLLKIKSDK